MSRQLFVAALFGLALSSPSKVDIQLSRVLESKGTANIVVSFRQNTQVVLNKIDAMRFETRGAKITAMKELLEQLAESSQKDVVALFKARAVSYESFWINNRVYVKNANASLVNAIADLNDVTHVREQITVHFDNPIFGNGTGINAEWGIAKIQAEEAWALPGGNNGAGVVVSNMDTGVRHTHEALRNNFRSDYGWYSPIDKSDTPVDNIGHGTHTMGTMAGSLGIGVAPGAQWIACGMDSSGPDESTLIACGQWIACPTRYDGVSEPDCSKAPDVVSNSWGGGIDQWFDEVIQIWHSAGIVPVFSIRNAGPACATTGYPGNSVEVIGVGSTTDTDGISTFSSRGPARSRAIKPDISAPGQDVRSSWFTSDNAYYLGAGTSMATPHVSATVGLLKAYNRNLTYSQIKTLLESTAVRTGLGMATYCGGIPINEFPNNVYGHGRLNALNALSAAINQY